MPQHTQFCHLPDYALLLIQGPDARTFLQGQVTCDIDLLQTNNGLAQSLLGAHCTHKGRVVFSFRIVALDEHTLALSIPKDMLETATNALKKYIVFSKAEIRDASSDYQCFGIYGEKASEDLSPYLNVTQPLEKNQAAISDNNEGFWMALDNGRYELWLSNEKAEQLLASDLEVVANTRWQLDTLLSGVAEIRPETSGLFTPHAINYQLVDTTISFQKGCYTGQEVVARMHYLGKLKRQMYLFTLPEGTTQSVTPGDGVFSPEKAQSVGDIVASVKEGQEHYILASVTTSLVEKNAIFLDSQATIPLRLSRTWVEETDTSGE